MRKLKEISQAFLILLTLASCSTQLKYSMRNTNFLTPESKGDFMKGDLSIALEKANKILLADAYEPLIFNLPAQTNSSSSISQTIETNFPITLGLIKQLDVYNFNDTYGLKYQFIGTPENEKKSEFKAALAFGYGYSHDSSDLTYTSTSSRIYSTDLKLKSYHSNLLFGYRVTDSGLFYLNIFYDDYSYKGTLSSNQFSTIYANGTSVNEGILLGAKSNWSSLISKVECGIVLAKLNAAKSLTTGTLEATVGWGW
jgi:hypothetical protein